MSRYKEYRFSLGNSSIAGFGLCFSIEAETAEEAVAIANERMRHGSLDLGSYCTGMLDAIVYWGPELKITEEDIEDVFDDDEEEVQ